MVTIKGFEEADPFREAAMRQLEALGVKGRLEVGRRRVMQVAGKTVVGFGVTLRELEDEGSLRVQYAGLGGKQRMGCGVFVPMGRGG
jgi:CRISPR-associated endonuclease/helicase Cas3